MKEISICLFSDTSHEEKNSEKVVWSIYLQSSNFSLVSVCLHMYFLNSYLWSDTAKKKFHLSSDAIPDHITNSSKYPTCIFSFYYLGGGLSEDELESPGSPRAGNCRCCCWGPWPSGICWSLNWLCPGLPGRPLERSLPSWGVCCTLRDWDSGLILGVGTKLAFPGLSPSLNNSNQCGLLSMTIWSVKQNDGHYVS